MRKNGFTLVELLVVIVILALLVTLGSKSLRSARTSAKKAQAMVEMQSIETAIKSYFNTYGKLPVEQQKQGQQDPAPSTAFSQEVIQILSAAHPTENPRGIVFIDPPAPALGPFLDPWNEPYLILLDTKYDGKIVYAGETLKRTAGVVATGLYLSQPSSNTNDLIKSWH